MSSVSFRSNMPPVNYQQKEAKPKSKIEQRWDSVVYEQGNVGDMFKLKKTEGLSGMEKKAASLNNLLVANVNPLAAVELGRQVGEDCRKELSTWA